MRDIPTPGVHDVRQPKEVSRELLGGKVTLFFADGKNPVELGPDMEDISESLDFALAKFYRENGNIFGKGRREAQVMAARCNVATQKFGEQLGTGDEDEESFLDEFPETKYFDVRSEGPFKEHYGDFHSIGMIVTPRKKEGGFDFVAIDLKHNAVSRDLPRATIFCATSEKDVYDALQTYYGGRGGWKANYVLMPERIGHTKDERQPYLYLDDESATQTMTEGV